MPEFLETTVDKFIFKVATDRLYSDEGVWLLDEGGRVRLGVTDYRQQLGGDVAFVHVKPVGTRLAAADEFVEVETIKANVSFRSPIAGRIAEINASLGQAPETLNQDPYGTGWLAVVEAADWQADRAKLLDAAAYLAAMRRQAEEEIAT
jgi:glycine cleavage system H protein